MAMAVLAQPFQFPAPAYDILAQGSRSHIQGETAKFGHSRFGGWNSAVEYWRLRRHSFVSYLHVWVGRPRGMSVGDSADLRAGII